MKKKNVVVRFALVALTVGMMTACGKGSGDSATSQTGEEIALDQNADQPSVSSKDEPGSDKKEIKVPGAGEDMQAFYAEFLKNYKFDNKLAEGEQTSESEDVTATMIFSFAQCGQNAMESFGVKRADGKKSVFEIYFTEDGYTYMKSNILDEEITYAKGKLDSSSSDEMLINAESVGLGEIAWQNFEYDHEEETDGIVYDVLKVNLGEDGQESIAYYYINREKQDIEMILAENGGENMIMYLSDIDSIEIPEKSLAAEEMSEEDFSETLMTELMAVYFSAAAEAE